MSTKNLFGCLFSLLGLGISIVILALLIFL